jgi:hypothetical protein
LHQQINKPHHSGLSLSHKLISLNCIVLASEAFGEDGEEWISIANYVTFLRVAEWEMQMNGGVAVPCDELSAALLTFPASQSPLRCQR